MAQAVFSWWSRITAIVKLLFWLLLIFWLYQMVSAPAVLGAKREAMLEQLQQQRKSRVIALIHRQETVSVLGVPVSSYIDIDDSEAILRAIRLTPPKQAIDVILHTPGGLVLAASQIARALVEHKGEVTVFVPHYAMSGGTLIALAADKIVMDPNAVLGPVDPQLGDYPAASIIKVQKLKKPAEISDEMLILADMAAKALVQIHDFVNFLLIQRMPKEKAANLATILTDGRWTHDFPITVDMAQQFGLTISTDMPRIVYEIMDLYPQAGDGRPSVLYTPLSDLPAQTNTL